MATYFKTPEGVLYLIISDGMGSGSEAAMDSGDAVKITEKLLKAGLGPDLAMSILDSAMLLRSDKSMGCASVDLMGINLFNGDTLMFKYGAAPSYVRKGGKVFQVNGESLAAGLGSGAPDLTRLKLSEGSAAVIISDGAVGCTDEILQRLYEIDGENVKRLAGSILESAARLGRSRDDMTVLAVSVEARK
jgi:stage II sporulation protein E